MKIGIIIPTIQGREEMLDQVLQAYEATCPAGYEFDVTIPEGYPSVGEAWNAGAQDVTGDYLHFGVDDAEPHEGWAESAVELAETGVLPSARLVTPDGHLEGCGSLGRGWHLPECPTGTPCRTTGIPFIPLDAWETIGEFLPIHYAVEDDWYWRATLHGHYIAACRGYSFTHHRLEEPGVISRADTDVRRFLVNAARHPVRA